MTYNFTNKIFFIRNLLNDCTANVVHVNRQKKNSNYRKADLNKDPFVNELKRDFLAIKIIFQPTNQPTKTIGSLQQIETLKY